MEVLAAAQRHGNREAVRNEGGSGGGGGEGVASRVGLPLPPVNQDLPLGPPPPSPPFAFRSGALVGRNLQLR